MACKFIYNNMEYSSKEEFINKLVIPNFINQPKTLRVQEQQSDFFQKIRNNFTIKGNNYTKSKDKDNNPIYFLNGKSISKSEHEKGWNEYLDTTENSEDAFLKLLLKNDNWITFFIKATIQNAAKKGYEKVLFPKGETAAKIEGHTTLEDELIKINAELEITLPWVISVGDAIVGGSFNTKEEAQKKLDSKENWKKANAEIIPNIKRNNLEKKKQELKSQGIEKLKPIEAFYEIKVGNILEKQFGKDNVKTITDEFGNQWREIDLKETIDKQDIFLAQVKPKPEYEPHPKLDEVKQLEVNLVKQLNRLSKLDPNVKDTEIGKKINAVITSFNNNNVKGQLYNYTEYAKYLLGDPINVDKEGKLDPKIGILKTRLDKLKSDLELPMSDEERDKKENEIANFLYQSTLILSGFENSVKSFSDYKIDHTDVKQAVQNMNVAIRNMYATGIAQEIEKASKDYFRSKLMRYTTNPLVLKGTMDMFEAQFDENARQGGMGALADTHNTFIQSLVKNYEIKMNLAREETIMKKRLWADLIKELKRSGKSTDDYLKRDSNGKLTDSLITEFDNSYRDEFFRQKRELDVLVKKGEDSDIYLNALRKHRIWKRNNIEHQYVDSYYGIDDKLSQSIWNNIQRINQKIAHLYLPYADQVDINGEIDKAIIDIETWDSIQELEAQRSKIYKENGIKYMEHMQKFADSVLQQEKYNKAEEYAIKRAAKMNPVESEEYLDNWYSRNTVNTVTEDFKKEYNTLGVRMQKVMAGIGKTDFKYASAWKQINDILNKRKFITDSVNPDDLTPEDIQKVNELEDYIRKGTFEARFLYMIKDLSKNMIINTDQYNSYKKELDRLLKGKNNYAELAKFYNTTKSDNNYQESKLDALEEVLSAMDKLYQNVKSEHYIRISKEKMLEGQDSFDKWHAENHVWDAYKKEIIPRNQWLVMKPKDEKYIANKAPNFKWYNWVFREDAKNFATDKEGNLLPRTETKRYGLDSSGYAVPKKQWVDKQYKSKDLANDKFYNQLTSLIAELTQHSTTDITKYGKIPAVQLDDLEKYSLKDNAKMTWQRFMDWKKKVKNKLTSEEAQDLLKQVRTDEAGNLTSTVPFHYLNMLKEEEYEQPTGNETAEELEALFQRNAEIYKKNKEFHTANVDTNIEKTMELFIDTAINFKYKQEMESEMLLAQEVLKNVDLLRSENILLDKFAKKVTGLDIPVTKKGIESTLYQHYNNWLKMIFYENFAEDEGLLKDAIDKLMQFTSLKNIGFNPFSGVNNVIVGKLNTFIESHAGIFTDRTSSKSGNKDYNNIMSSIIANRKEQTDTTLIGGLIKKFDIMENQDETGLNGGKLSTKQHKLLWLNSAAYALQHIGEHYMQNQMLLSMMHFNKVIDGKIVNKREYLQRELAKKDNIKTKELLTAEFDAAPKYVDIYELKDGYAQLKKDIKLDKEEEANFRRKVIGVNQYMHGIYNKQHAGAWQRFAIMRLAIQFRKWMNPGWNKRFGSRFGEGFHNEHRETYEEGMYITTAKFAIELIKDYKNLISRARIEWSTMTDEAKANVKRTAIEMLALTSSVILVMILKGLKGKLDDDDKKLKTILNLMLLQTNRLKVETGNYLPIDPFPVGSTSGLLNEGKALLKSPAASLGTLEQIGTLGKELLMFPIRMFIDGKEYKTTLGTIQGEQIDKGIYKDAWRLPLAVGKVTPLVSQLIRLYYNNQTTEFMKNRPQ